jgi:hypothetical protein
LDIDQESSTPNWDWRNPSELLTVVLLYRALGGDWQ